MRSVPQLVSMRGPNKTLPLEPAAMTQIKRQTQANVRGPKQRSPPKALISRCQRRRTQASLTQVRA